MYCLKTFSVNSDNRQANFFPTGIQVKFRCVCLTDGPGKVEKFLGDDDGILNSLSRRTKIIYILLQGVWIMRELSKSDIVGNLTYFKIAS